MGFRDDDLAARSQVEALKGEVRELRAKNAELEARPANSALGNSPRNDGSPSPLLLIAVFTVIGFGLLVMLGAALAQDHALRVMLAVLAAVLFSFAPPLALLRNLRFVPAQHLLVISGRQRHTADGKQIGYRIVTSGVTFCIPFLEKSETLATGPLFFETRIAGVYLKGNTPANLCLRASVRVPTSEPTIHNAIDRFLGRESTEIEKVAKETLEGTIREVAARMSREELQTDRLRIAAELSRSTSQADFERLGLSLDSFEILDVTYGGG